MSSSISKPSSLTAREIWFDASMIHVRLSDGRELGVPLEWFPKLRQASERQRVSWRLIGDGVGIHWEELDEDISVAGLLEAQPHS